MTIGEIKNIREPISQEDLRFGTMYRRTSGEEGYTYEITFYEDGDLEFECGDETFLFELATLEMIVNRAKSFVAKRKKIEERK